MARPCAAVLADMVASADEVAETGAGTADMAGTAAGEGKTDDAACGGADAPAV